MMVKAHSRGLWWRAAAMWIAALVAALPLRATETASTPRVVGSVMDLPADFEENADFVEALSRGWDQVREVELDMAEASARDALDAASTREMRAWAARLIGRIYFSRPHPKSSDRLVAWQYLSSAEALTALPALRESVWPEMVDTAEGLGDLHMMIAVAARVRAASTNTVLRNAMDVKMLKLAVARGSWRDYTNVLGQITVPADKEPEAFHYKRQLLAANERLLRDATWFVASFAGQSAMTEAQMRTQLTETTLRSYDRLMTEATGANRADLILDYARFLYGMASYPEAMKFVKEYLAGADSSRADEALLLEVRLGVKLGQLADCATAAEAFVRRNGLSAETVAMVRDLSDVLDKTGQMRAARALLSSTVKLEGPPLLMRPLVEILLGMEIRSGHVEEAEQLYRRQKRAALPSTELAAMALGGAKQFIARSDWTNAVRWLEWHVAAIPGHTLNADALYAVHQALCGMDGYGTSALEYGAAALRAETSDPRAGRTRQNIGEILENMGLYLMADRFYRGAGVTGYIRGDTRTDSQRSLSGMGLRSGRCLVKAGRLEEADQMLREACNSTVDPDVRAESAAWWALVAYGMGQRIEGARRLGLSDPARLSPELVARLAIVRDLSDPVTGSQRAERLELMLTRVKALPPPERTAAARRIVSEVVGQMRDEGDYASILRLYSAPSSGLTHVVSLEQAVLQRGEALVHTQGVDALVSLLEKETQGATNAPAFIQELHSELLDMQAFRREADVAVKRYMPQSPGVGR